MSNAETNIKAKVDAFVNDLSDLIRQSALEAVADALRKGGEVAAPAPVARRPGRPAKVVEAAPVAAKPAGITSKAPTLSRLKVVREFDSAVGPACAGRMVISGRMADVCAELDRLAQRDCAAL